MDRQLTERMIGAALLLGALVVVVPMILDGSGQPARMVAKPDREPIDLRTHTIHLDGAERAPPVPRARVAADAGPVAADRPAPGSTVLTPPDPPAVEPGDDTTQRPAGEASAPPVAASSSKSKPAPAPASSPASTSTSTAAPAVAAAPAPAPPPARTEPASGAWYVQLGSFSSRDNAKRLAADLERKGFKATISPLTASGGKTLYRVRTGGFKTREEAAQLASRLAGAGFPGGQVAQ
jgi:cell division septation protein DedD